MYAAVTPCLRLPRGLSEWFDYKVPEELESAVVRGSVVQIPWRGKRATGIVKETRATADIPANRIKALLSVGPGLIYPEDAVAALEWIAEDCFCPLPTAAAGFVPEMPARAAKKTDLPGARSLSQLGPRLRGDGISFVPAHSWQEKMDAAAAAVRRAIEAQRAALVITPHLEELPLLEHSLRDAFPGISLISFGGSLSAGELWRRTEAAALPGQKIIIGTRNAVLAPAPDLAAIAILEPESRDLRSFDQQPRFDARSAALRRAELTGSQLTLIGAALRLEEAAHIAALPGASPASPVLVDAGGMGSGPLSRLLPQGSVDAIAEALQRGQSAFLFHNRRGEYGGVICRDCKAVLRCPQCKAALASPRAGAVACRRCGASGAMPLQCGQCQSPSLASFGAGTAALAKALAAEFPEAKILRADGDERAQLGTAEGADILIGTQLLLHRLAELPPGSLRLGAVIATSIDDLMLAPDFRSSERAWQTVQQLRGAAGAHGCPLLLQTVRPDSPAVRRLLDSPADFLQRENDERRAAGYPPHGRAVTVSVPAGTDSRKLLADFRASAAPGVSLFGPLTLRGPRPHAVIALKAATLAALRPTLEKAPEICNIDTNPDSLA